MSIEGWFDAICEAGKESREREFVRKGEMIKLVDRCLDSHTTFRFKINSLNEMRKEGILKDGEFFEILDKLLKEI